MQLHFTDADFPPALYTMFTGDPSTPTLQFRLPDDYSSDKQYPLLVYLPGFHGHPGGNIQNAIDIGGKKGWIVASLPLFKKTIDPDEYAKGVIVSLEDYPVLSKAYRKMLGRLYEIVPNIDHDRSGMAGFSNGAIAIGVLVSNHDDFILRHFKNFCVVDQGMFHLMDLHKSRSRDCRFLILVGDQEGMGRAQKIEQSKLLCESMQLLPIDLQYLIMKNVGHELEPCEEVIGRWMRQEIQVRNGEIVMEDM